VAESSGPYATSRSVTFGHLNAELYFVDAFDVEARIWLNRVSMTGLLYAVDMTASVWDQLDRSRKYVTWPSHWAHFENDGTGHKWWHRRARPSLHRTAVAARCLVLREHAASVASHDMQGFFQYSDALPFPAGDLVARRRAVCNYCFFGGSDKAQPLPDEDWFIR
jgi:hypothetical protein